MSMRKSGWWTGVAVAIALVSVHPGVPAAIGQDLGTHAFVDVTVVPMDRDRVLENQTVLVDGDRITRVGAAAEVEIPEGTVRIEGNGLYLMPGLAEMHAHIPGSNAPRAYLENTLFLYLANGITTIRGMLGEPAHLELREQAQRGEILSPRIYTSGPSLNGNSVDSPERAREMVLAQAEAGYDFLKLHPGLSRAAFDAIDATADEVGMPFAGHVSLDVGLARTLEAGQATIDHLDGYVEAMAGPPHAQSSQFFGLNLVGEADLDELPRLVGETVEAGVWNVPTQALFPDFLGDPDELLRRPELRYVSAQQAQQWAGSVRQMTSNPSFSADDGRRFLELRRRVLKSLHDAGAGILLGSDAPQVFNVPGFSMHEELAEYVRAGLSPFEALRTGTVEVARFYGVDDERGTVAEGMVADLVLVRGNPLEDVGNVREPAGVMLRGRWLPGDQIEQRLEEIATAYGN
ncbi:MAG TPA: amidohydrolase family protein [Gemmatimonadota bacterium]|nr:amidohydrolase family protein [Gemmatimonadota bacterium]